MSLKNFKLFRVPPLMLFFPLPVPFGTLRAFETSLFDSYSCNIRCSAGADCSFGGRGHSDLPDILFGNKGAQSPNTFKEIFDSRRHKFGGKLNPYEYPFIRIFALVLFLVQFQLNFISSNNY